DESRIHQARGGAIEPTEGVLGRRESVARRQIEVEVPGSRIRDEGEGAVGRGDEPSGTSRCEISLLHVRWRSFPRTARYVSASVVNHSDRSVTGRVYDKYDRLPERRHALDAWARGDCTRS